MIFARFVRRAGHRAMRLNTKEKRKKNNEKKKKEKQKNKTLDIIIIVSFDIKRSNEYSMYHRFIHNLIISTYTMYIPSIHCVTVHENIHVHEHKRRTEI